MSGKKMIQRKALIGGCVLAFFVAACGPAAENAPGSTEDQEGSPEQETATVEALRKPETVAERREVRQQMAAEQAERLQGLGRPPADDADPVRGEVPDEILQKIIGKLMTDIAADRADIAVLHAESLTWNDGSLGCGKPGQFYTQALVPGYRVVLGHAGQQYDYRATERGLFMLCEQPGLAAPGAGGTPPVQ
jgi:hypothetical protein